MTKGLLSAAPLLLIIFQKFWRLLTSAPYADSLGLLGSFDPGLPSSTEESYNDVDNDGDGDEYVDDNVDNECFPNVYVEIFCVFLEAYDDHHGHLLPHYLDEVLGFVKKSKSCVSRTVTADRYLTSING